MHVKMPNEQKIPAKQQENIWQKGRFLQDLFSLLKKDKITENNGKISITWIINDRPSNNQKSIILA